MKRLVGAGMVLISAIGFGAMPIFARIAYQAGTAPITVLFLRFTTAALVMFALLAARRTPLPRGKLLVGLILMGCLGYVGQSLAYFHALTFASASLVALLLYLYPALVTAISAVWLKERITPIKFLALGMALAGAVLTIGVEIEGTLTGVILALSAALIYSVYIVSGSKLMKSVSSIPASTVIIASAGAVYSGLIAWQGARLPQTSAGWAAVIAIALFSTVVSIVAFFAGLERVGPVNASTLSILEPLVTVALAAIVLGEALTVWKISGGALILAAVILLTRGELAAN